MAAAYRGVRGKGAGAHDAYVGLKIGGRYRILDRLAVGGMARVYRARPEGGGAAVALKLLELDTPDGQRGNFETRFVREASLIARFRHPHIVRLLDFGRDPRGPYFMVMELVRGITLDKLLRDQGRLAPRRAVDIALQIASALHEAHAAGVVHRDIKPSNVMRVDRRDGPEVVKLLDFGLAKRMYGASSLTRTGYFLGSPKYASPEHANSPAVDQRSDVYSLGVLLYRMLSGRVPFDDPNPVAIVLAHANSPVPPLRLGEAAPPPELETIVLRCLAKRPSDRFDSMASLHAALLATRGRLQAYGSRRSRRSTDPRRRQRPGWTLARLGATLGVRGWSPLRSSRKRKLWAMAASLAALGALLLVPSSFLSFAPSDGASREPARSRSAVAVATPSVPNRSGHAVRAEADRRGPLPPAASPDAPPSRIRTGTEASGAHHFDEWRRVGAGAMEPPPTHPPAVGSASRPVATGKQRSLPAPGRAKMPLHNRSRRATRMRNLSPKRPSAMRLRRRALATRPPRLQSGPNKPSSILPSPNERAARSHATDARWSAPIID